MKVLACYSIKGGVGKTATAVNLAYSAAQAGLRMLLVDLDPQGASSFYFRVRPASGKARKAAASFFDAERDGAHGLASLIKASDFDNLDIIPAHLAYRHFDTDLADLNKRDQRLKRALKALRHEYDLIILDCPPSIGYLAEAVFVASDVLLVPVIPTTLSERTFEQLLAFFGEGDYPSTRIVPFFSMVQAQKALHQATMAAMAARHPAFLATAIPYSADVENMGEHKAPLGAYAAAKPAGEAYRQLWRAVAAVLPVLPE